MSFSSLTLICLGVALVGTSRLKFIICSGSAEPFRAFEIVGLENVLLSITVIWLELDSRFPHSDLNEWAPLWLLCLWESEQIEINLLLFSKLCLAYLSRKSHGNCGGLDDKARSCILVFSTKQRNFSRSLRSLAMPFSSSLFCRTVPDWGMYFGEWITLLGN